MTNRREFLLGLGAALPITSLAFPQTGAEKTSSKWNVLFLSLRKVLPVSHNRKDGVPPGWGQAPFLHG